MAMMEHDKNGAVVVHVPDGLHPGDRVRALKDQPARVKPTGTATVAWKLPKGAEMVVAEITVDKKSIVRARVDYT